MSYEIIITRRFEKEFKRLLKRYSSLKKEFFNFTVLLSKNPTLGTFIGNHCYKVRIAISSKGKGKSGGARIITYVYAHKQVVYLLSVYDKSEKQDLKPNELKEMITVLDLG